MSREHFTRVTSVVGISIFSLGIGLALSACSPTTSSAAAPPAAGTTTASAPATPVTSAPAPTSSASTGAVAPSSTPTTAPSSAPAVTPTSTTANATPVRIADNGPFFVLWQCNTGKPLVEPTNYVLSCGDGGNGLTGVHWTSWTPNGATGVGTEYLNDCLPNCAEGKIIDYPVDISLTGSYLAEQDEPFSYAKITLTYLAARPTIYVTVNGKVEATQPGTWSPPLPLRPASHLTHPTSN